MNIESTVKSEIELAFHGVPSTLHSLYKAWKMPYKDRALFLHGAFMFQLPNLYSENVEKELYFLCKIASIQYMASMGKEPLHYDLNP